MIGLIVAIVLMFLEVDLQNVLLAFIGFELFGISYHLNYFRVADLKKQNSFACFVEGLRKGLQDGRRNEKDSDRDKDRDGE